MITGIDKKGEMKNVILNDDGSVPVKMEGEIQQTSDKEITLNASIQTLSTEETTITVGKKVTMIMIANYSDTSDVTITVSSKIYQVGAGLALELPMNVLIDNLILTSTEADTKIQLVIKGVE